MQRLGERAAAADGKLRAQARVDARLALAMPARLSGTGRTACSKRRRRKRSKRTPSRGPSTFSPTAFECT